MKSLFLSVLSLLFDMFILIEVLYFLIIYSILLFIDWLFIIVSSLSITLVLIWLVIISITQLFIINSIFLLVIIYLFFNFFYFYWNRFFIYFNSYFSLGSCSPYPSVALSKSRVPISKFHYLSVLSFQFFLFLSGIDFSTT